MKKLLFLAIASLFAFQTQAQLLKFGVRAGVSSSSISADDLRFAITDGSTEDLEAKAGDATVGFHVGLMSQINLPVVPIMIIPELLFTSTGGEVSVRDLNQGTAREVTKTQRFGRLDIPVMVAYKLGPARLQAGPIASFVLSENNGLLDAVKEVGGSVADGVSSDEVNAATWGFQAGVGVNILSKIALDLKYEGSLSRFGDGVQVGGQTRNFDSRSSQILLSVGYLF